MPPFVRLLQLKITSCVRFVICLVTIIYFFTFYGKYNYTHTPLDEIDNQLYKAINPNLALKKSIPDCTYDDILKSEKSLKVYEIPKTFDNFSATGLANGSYVPEHCNPVFSVAILVTYRNRQSQLNIFLPYMHNFLRKQNIHYKIYLIEQQDEKEWNKGALYNIGAKHAILEKFPCLILQDVDLLPLDESNLYVCMKEPRHLSASIDKFRYVLTYDTLVGGVFAIKSEHYTLVNGFSNRFKGWGGEDDDFAARIAAQDLSILRFPREMSTYTMLVHGQEAKNKQRLRIMSENKKDFNEDGLNSVHYESVQTCYYEHKDYYRLSQGNDSLCATIYQFNKNKIK